ncbi:MAG: hypothetical protein EXR98_05015 [Gemmataceae bacterium]|nr:hypothetical protein [Gemmataceae bacterium]
MAVDSLLDRAEKAVREGELWRAKEILQGGIRGRGYDQAIFERLGLVLLQMGDLLEAGKHLFLSGRRETSYEKAISLFLGRFTRATPLQLYSTFPKAARLARRDDYPPPVSADLERLGLPEELPVPIRRTYEGWEGLSGKRIGFGCLAVVVVVLGLAVVGTMSAINWVTSN